MPFDIAIAALVDRSTSSYISFREKIFLDPAVWGGQLSVEEAIRSFEIVAKALRKPPSRHFLTSF